VSRPVTPVVRGEHWFKANGIRLSGIVREGRCAWGLPIVSKGVIQDPLMNGLDSV
jgi:hypothetical protein